MKTSYLKCKDIELLNEFICVPPPLPAPKKDPKTGLSIIQRMPPYRQDPNIIGYIQPQTGIKATKATKTEEGIEYPAQEQIGDPDYWYTCIQFKDKYELPKDIEEVDEKIGKQIVGVWAGE